MSKSNRNVPAPAADQLHLRPLVGDFVHYVSCGDSLDAAPSAHRAALVVGIAGDTASLLVHRPDGKVYRQPDVVQDETGKSPGTWHTKD